MEGYKLSGTKNSGRETVIWRIEFASDSITPSKACQVWGTPVDNGSNNIHDYADFGLKDVFMISILPRLLAVVEGSIGR